MSADKFDGEKPKEVIDEGNHPVVHKLCTSQLYLKKGGSYVKTID